MNTESIARRANRAVRSNTHRKLRLAERDLWLLEGLAKMRFLTTYQIARLYFNGAQWYPSKRLRRLLDAGLVRAWVRNLAEENIYSITRGGIAAILKSTEGSAQLPKPPAGLDENLPHLLAINEVRVALALTLPQAGGEILWWRSDWELRAHGRERVIPDGLFSIRWQGATDQVYTLEVDNNTRSSKNFLKKILAYISIEALGGKIYGVAAPIILVAGSDPRWLERYRASVKGARLGGRVWFAALEDIGDEGALAAIWINAREEKCSLRELTSCPYGKDISSR